MPLLLAVPLLLGLAGCDPPSWYLSAGAHSSGGARIKVTAPFSGTETFLPGASFTPNPGGTETVANEVIRGPFSAPLPGKVDIGGVTVKKLNGSFVTTMGGTYTPSQGTGTFTGTELIKWSKGKLGMACVTFTSNVTNRGVNESGPFQLAGGTGNSARARLSGTFTEIVNQTGSTATVSGSVSARGKGARSSRPLNATCKSLRGQL